jgi:hypothetical protein
MKKINLILLVLCQTINSQSLSKFNERYYDHWETVNPEKSLLEVIIYKNKETTRIIELDFNSKCDDIGAAILFPTVYVHKKINGIMAVESINPSTMELLDSNYILTKDDRLLRILKNDTLVFKRRY